MFCFRSSLFTAKSHLGFKVCASTFMKTVQNLGTFNTDVSACFVLIRDYSYIMVTLKADSEMTESISMKQALRGLLPFHQLTTFCMLATAGLQFDDSNDNERQYCEHGPFENCQGLHIILLIIKTNHLESKSVLVLLLNCTTKFEVLMLNGKNCFLVSGRTRLFAISILATWKSA